MEIQTLNDSDGKTSWMRVAASLWVVLCGASIVAVLYRNTDLPTNVLSMMQTGFGSLVLAYIGGKIRDGITRR